MSVQNAFKAGVILPTKPFEGQFGALTLLDNGTKIRKSYLEDRSNTNVPYLFTASNKVYLFEHVSEHEAHKLLCQHFPDQYPKIYEYSEKRYLDIPEAERPNLPEFLVHTKAKPENLVYCTVTMEFIKYPTLRDIFNETIHQSTKAAIRLLKLWFKNQLDMIREAHIQPNDCHVGNMLSNFPDDFVFIDYGFYQKFTIIDEIPTDRSIDDDIGYNLDPKTNEISKINIRTNEVTKLTKRDHIKLSNHDVEMLLLDILRFELSRSLYQSLHNSLYLLFPTRLDEIYTKAMTELNLSTRFQRDIMVAIHNGRINRDVVYSVNNWLGGGNKQHVPIHRMLTFMRTNPDEFEALNHKWNDEQIAKIRKMSVDEFFTYVNNPDNKITRIERHLLQMRYRGYSPRREWMCMYSYVVNNLESSAVLYRLEFTNRFNDKDGNCLLKPNQSIHWDNLISSAPSLRYALTFANKWAGSGNDEPNGCNYVFKFTNSKAALIRRTPDDFTTYVISCNAADPEDKNWMKYDRSYRIRVSNEYILDPNSEYEIISITPGQSQKVRFTAEEREIKYTLVELKSTKSSSED